MAQVVVSYQTSCARLFRGREPGAHESISKKPPAITLQFRPYEADSAFGLSQAKPLSYRSHKCHIVQLDVVHFAALFKAVLDVVMGNSLSASPHQ